MDGNSRTLQSIGVLFLTFVCISGCRVAEVDPGKLYRSPQLKKQDLQTLTEKLKIKTIINLRGSNPGQEWYDDEVSVAEEKGIQLIDIGMSAGRLPHREDLITLLDGFKYGEYPMLIHCKAGVDRTGEAAAIYQMQYMGKPRGTALKMLDASFGYFEFQPAKKYFISEIWVDEKWAREQYDPCEASYKYYDPNNPKCRKNVF
jgi:protein tyrosine phosphatase (PTP) superfamily phosphohydrolase (DUF442 family)